MMKKLAYKSEEAPTPWGIVNVPDKYDFISCGTDDTPKKSKYNEALELALKNWIPIRVEDQEKVNKVIWNWLCENEDGAKLIYDLAGETKICNHITWKPESKLYDIQDGMEFELKGFIKCELQFKSWTESGFCKAWSNDECRCEGKQFYALKSKIEEKPKEETRPIDLELLQSSTAGMLSYCMDHDKNNSLIPELKKHKRTIEMMKVEDTKEAQRPSIEQFNSIDDLRYYLLRSNNPEMVRSSCLHYLGDKFQKFNLYTKETECQAELVEMIAKVHDDIEGRYELNSYDKGVIQSLLCELQN